MQAGWTRPTRTWLYGQAGLAQSRDVLEVGCGTGAVAGELARRSAARVVGLDVDARLLAFARRQSDGVICVRGDAHALPFPEGCFDVVVCHYLLLWLADPAQGLREMARVVRPSGAVLACAEPDYGGRVDYPPEMAPVGRLQAEALRRQGAEPELGRRLGELFAAAGLHGTVGVMAGRWEFPSLPDEGFEAEWTMRARDLDGVLAAGKLARLRAVDRRGLKSGRRTLYVPTFYALGRRVLRV